MLGLDGHKQKLANSAKSKYVCFLIKQIYLSLSLSLSLLMYYTHLLFLLIAS